MQSEYQIFTTMKFEIILSNTEITQITIQRILSLFCEYECKKDVQMHNCTIIYDTFN